MVEQSAYLEQMEVTLAKAGGRYAVHAASGQTYEVDATRDECTCQDYLQNEPEGGCKHIRRSSSRFDSVRLFPTSLNYNGI